MAGDRTLNFSEDHQVGSEALYIHRVLYSVGERFQYVNRRVCIQIGPGIELGTIPKTTKSLSIRTIKSGKSTGSDELADVMTKLCTVWEQNSWWLEERKCFCLCL